MKPSITTSNTRPTDAAVSGSWHITKGIVGIDGYNVWLTRLRDGKKVTRVTQQTDKMNMCKWDGRAGMNAFALFLDFDAVPSFLVDRMSMSTSMDMDSFEKYLRFTYPNECVFRSAGGNVKMMVLFENCTKKEALEELKETFTELWPYADKNGLEHTIVPFGAVDQINDFIHSREARNGHDVEPTEWRMSNDPYIVYWSKLYYGSKRRELTLFMMSIRTSGPVVALPMTLMAQVCKCSTSTVKSFIDVMIKNGEIECVDAKYVPGSKSRLYRIKNEHWLRAMGLHWKPDQKWVNKVDYTEFVDGNWFNALWNHTRLFATGVEFMLFVHGIEGAYAHGKHRIAKARSAWRSHAKRNGLSLEVC